MNDKCERYQPSKWLTGGALLLISTWCGTAAVIESNLSKTFPADPGGKLVMDVDSGAIKISTQDTSEVRVQVLRKTEGLSAAKAAALFAEHDVQFKAGDGTVEVKGRFTSGNKVWNRGREKLEISYDVAVPKSFNLDLRTAAGSIDCAAIQGKVKAVSGGGGMKFHGVDGSIEAKTSAGGLQLDKVKGSTDLKSGGGGIKVGDSEGLVKIETSAGSIEIQSAAGKVSATSHGGGINAGVLLDAAELKTHAGAIQVREAKGPLQVESGGGSIKISSASTTVQARTSAGSIQAAFIGQPAADSRLQSGGGSIDVTLAPGLGFELSAQTGGGGVATEIPVVAVIQGDHHRDQIKGKIGAGGPALEIKTGAGSIHVRKGPER